jgi:uncharacterized protein (DUF952 family)
MTAPIFHLTPAVYYQAQPVDQPYVPATFAQEGFIHCTAGEERLLQVANHYFVNLPGELLALELDPARLTAHLVFEPPISQQTQQLGQPAYAATPTVLFPHLYGPLNRQAIVGCIVLQRDVTGRWVMPTGDQ